MISIPGMSHSKGTVSSWLKPLSNPIPFELKDMYFFPEKLHVECSQSIHKLEDEGSQTLFDKPYLTFICWL